MEWQQCCKRLVSIIFSIDCTGHLCGKLAPLALLKQSISSFYCTDYGMKNYFKGLKRSSLFFPIGRINKSFTHLDSLQDNLVLFAFILKLKNKQEKTKP